MEVKADRAVRRFTVTAGIDTPNDSTTSKTGHSTASCCGSWRAAEGPWGWGRRVKRARASSFRRRFSAYMRASAWLRRTSSGSGSAGSKVETPVEKAMVKSRRPAVVLRDAALEAGHQLCGAHPGGVGDEDDEFVPPSRATRSRSRKVARNRVANSKRARSPAWWPRRSLICFSPSRSAKMTSIARWARTASSSCARARSTKPRRLCRPVSSSTWLSEPLLRCWPSELRAVPLGDVAVNPQVPERLGRGQHRGVGPAPARARRRVAASLGRWRSGPARVPGRVLRSGLVRGTVPGRWRRRGAAR